MKNKFLNFYMNIALNTAELSSARRTKVGAVIVRDDNIIAFGYNGTLPGTDNNCESEIPVTCKNLHGELWEYLLKFPRKKINETDSVFYNVPFWYKEKCYVLNKIKSEPTVFLNEDELTSFEPMVSIDPMNIPYEKKHNNYISLNIANADLEYSIFYELVTKPEVIHAEQNALYKLTRNHQSSKDATMFITHAPCAHCTNALIISRIKEIYYRFNYHSSGIETLKNAGIAVNKLK